MNAGVESTVGLVPDSTGKKVRTIEVTTFISGVPTTVEMQVLSLADGNGNVIDDFASYRFQIALINELQQLRELLGRVYGQATFATPLTQ